MANDYLRQIGFGILTVASFMVIFYHQLHYERNNRSYFANSIIDFLKETKKRLKFLAKRIWYIIIWALFDLGVCFLIAADFSNHYLMMIGVILIIQLILAIAIFSELYFGYKKWKKIRKPLITEIEHILQEIQEA
jgi:cell division protein FtsW (lipid II flippase)